MVTDKKVIEYSKYSLSDAQSALPFLLSEMSRSVECGRDQELFTQAVDFGRTIEVILNKSPKDGRIFATKLIRLVKAKRLPDAVKLSSEYFEQMRK